ncbi:hypothetical protein LOZ66_004324 [Ophidiomyces ophidiicola]|nr:hypothetical protein LOZ66_004324 [Ophidiomyces ophidiicola]
MLGTVLAIDDVKVIHTTTLEVVRRNLLPRVFKIQLVKGKSVAVTTTEGWNITGKVSLTLGQASLEVGGGYTSTTERSITESQQTWDTLECSPNTECRLETWSFGVRVKGRCKVEPRFDCYGEKNPCDGSTRPQASSFGGGSIIHREKGRGSWQGDGVCPEIRSHAMRYSQKSQEIPCEAELPLVGPEGEIMTLMVASEVQLGK